MKSKNAFLYLAALAAFFLLGCGTAFVLRALDIKADSPAPLEGGQALSLPGLTLRVPESYFLEDYTELTDEADVLFTVIAQDGAQALYLHGYTNEQGDTISDYPEQELVTYYTHAGCEEVRTRVIGGRRFICYSAQAQADDGRYQIWYAYETWDAALHLVIETNMYSQDVLPILMTMEFTEET